MKSCYFSIIYFFNGHMHDNFGLKSCTVSPKPCSSSHLPFNNCITSLPPSPSLPLPPSPSLSLPPSLPPSRWCVYKHSRPLSEEIVRFLPYQDSEDVYRGTTVLPYLEFFYQYGTANDDTALPVIERSRSFLLQCISGYLLFRTVVQGARGTGNGRWPKALR